MKHYFVLIAVTITLIACEKKVDFIPLEQPAKLVVDAQIESGGAPLVVLTKSLSFFSNINPQLLASSFVNNALITVSNGTQTTQLKEYTINLINGYKLFYYTIDSSSPTSFYGQYGQTYNMNISVNGETYTATTTIPLLSKKIDSLWWKPAPNNSDTTRVVMMCRVTDPLGFGNYIRYFTKINRDAFLPGINSVFDDQIVDGTTYDIQVDQGVDRNQEIDRENFGFFKRGDTATLKLCNIDKASYNFWNTWEFSLNSVGNPFSTPNKVLGNISNGALGVFCGYAVQEKTIIIPK